MMQFEIGVWGGCKVKRNSFLFKEWYKTIFGASFFFFKIEWYTNINESLKLEVIYVLYTDFKTFTNFVVSCD